MNVEVLYIADCPGWQTAQRLVERALADTGRSDVIVQARKIGSRAEAMDSAFAGSPTILVDGVDLFARGSSLGELACRMYETPAGLAPAPRLDQMIAALELHILTP